MNIRDEVITPAFDLGDYGLTVSPRVQVGGLPIPGYAAPVTGAPIDIGGNR